MNHFSEYRQHIAGSPSELYKALLVDTPRLQVVLYRLEPGQAQALHTHSLQDTIGVVLEGEGTFTIAGETRTVGEGGIVWVPAGEEHGMENGGERRLVLFMVVAPGSGD